MSNDKSVLSIGLAHQLDMAFVRNGWVTADVNLLSKGNVLKSVRDSFLGKVAMNCNHHIIDCSAGPDMSRVPPDWDAEEHRKHGLLVWNPSRISLYRSEKQQKNGECVDGLKLRVELQGKNVLNANVLDYLLMHVELIPENWKQKRIFFWGTIYKSYDNTPYVRCLYWTGKRWHCNKECLWNGFYGGSPAAIYAGA